MKKIELNKAFKLLFLSVFLVVVGVGSWLIYALFLKNNTQTIAVEMIPVTQGQVEDKITGESGVLKLDSQRAIKSSTTGTVEQILVKIGDPVKKGQVLIRLRDRDSQIKLQEFQLDLKDKTVQINEKHLAVRRSEKKLIEASQDYQKLLANYLKDIENKKQEKSWEIEKQTLDLKKKQQAISQAEIDLAEAKVKLTEDEQLFSKGFISETDLQERQKKVVQAQTSLNNAQDELSVTKIELYKQKLDWQNFLKSVKENSSEPQQKLKESLSKVEQSQQDSEQAKLALHQLIRELDKVKIERQKVIEELRQKVITAPSNGMVLNLQVKTGDVIEPKSSILLIGDPTQQIVELKLSPLDANKVKLKQQAEVTIIGLESKKLTGKIQQISLLATEDQNSLQGGDNVKVTAVVGLDRNNLNIIPGTPVTVTLILSQRNQVLVLPNEAIQQNETETFVWMKDNQGKAVKRNIKIGLQGLDNTEIKSGLKQGDEVLIPSIDNPLNEDSYVKIK
ncbi:HlyD family efflux transporter periplasmic adaptor subunit [Microcystis aeruginosa]|uniref:Membrane fusion protein biotin-lipoyl like domain-containing protein n=1 Tax=Microcystis aeruginosa NIES-3807 TaxID=2517785 RepID=A0AAD3B3B2_MICAE|nr:HlyD family efflux transporter periplasmic adaptor subunit [Microcystis aeruginosa]GCL60782.1 hypothetical protein NIES3807_39670 [Microcystis aeruginosa NIES-3807]